jgi:hypothetical protein
MELKKVMVMAAIPVEITVLIALEPRITGIMWKEAVEL